MDEKIFTKVTTKLLKQLIFEKEKLNFLKFAIKYNLPFKLRKKLKRQYIKWTIIDVMLILELLKIDLYDFAVMLEENLKKEEMKYEQQK